MPRANAIPADPDVQLLQALADPTRLAIVRELAGSTEVCACDFTSCCEVAQPTVSHHLKVLREAGWVSSERRGTWIWYRLRPEAISRFGGILGQASAAAGSGRNAARALPMVRRDAIDAVPGRT